MDTPFSIHVGYVGEDPGRPIDVSVSNPDVANIQPHPGYPGDYHWVMVTPVAPGAYVVGIFDGVIRGALPEMVVVPPGVAPPLADFEVVLG